MNGLYKRKSVERTSSSLIIFERGKQESDKIAQSNRPKSVIVDLLHASIYSEEFVKPSSRQISNNDSKIFILTKIKIQ